MTSETLKLLAVICEQLKIYPSTIKSHGMTCPPVFSGSYEAVSKSDYLIGEKNWVKVLLYDLRSGQEIDNVAKLKSNQLAVIRCHENSNFYGPGESSSIDLYDWTPKPQYTHEDGWIGISSPKWELEFRAVDLQEPEWVELRNFLRSNEGKSIKDKNVGQYGLHFVYGDDNVEKYTHPAFGGEFILPVLKQDQFEEFMNKGHWIQPDDIDEYGLELVYNYTYYCRQDGTCNGHQEYTHPVFGGCFHLADCARTTE